MKFVDLFAGIGGISLGLERAGMTCAGHVELNPYSQKVLARHWPDVPQHADVRTFHGDEFGPFDLLAGGYPCQPFSVAGKRDGANDPRHLWPEVLRIIRNVRPRYVLLENVRGHLSLGFDVVLGALAESGYDAEWDCIPASAVGAPHQRDRLWVVAYRDGHPGERWAEPSPASEGWRPSAPQRPHVRREGASRPHHPRSSGSVLAGGHWATEPDVGRVADGVPARVDRLRSLGNAVVPQVAEHIGRRILTRSTGESWQS